MPECALIGSTFVVPLCLDNDLVHVIVDGTLMRTLPLQLSTQQRTRLQGAHTSGSLSSIDHRPTRVLRHVSAGGSTNVIDQRIQVGLRHARRIVTIEIHDTQMRVSTTTTNSSLPCPAPARRPSSGTKPSGENRYVRSLRVWQALPSRRRDSAREHTMDGHDSRRFHRFGFEPNYTVEVDPPFPPDGTWDSPIVEFDTDGRAHARAVFDVRRALIARVEPAQRTTWLGVFANGGLGQVDETFACPGPGQLCVVAEGMAYLVNVDTPIDGAVIAQAQVQHVAADAEHQLLLLASDIDLVAVGVNGLAWRSPRLALDGLSTAGADSEGIHCHAWLGDHDGTTEPITIDPHTGQVAAGPVLPDQLRY